MCRRVRDSFYEFGCTRALAPYRRAWRALHLCAAHRHQPQLICVRECELKSHFNARETTPVVHIINMQTCSWMGAHALKRAGNFKNIFFPSHVLNFCSHSCHGLKGMRATPGPSTATPEHHQSPIIRDERMNTHRVSILMPTNYFVKPTKKRTVYICIGHHSLEMR